LAGVGCGEAAHFEKESLKVVDDRLFEIGLYIGVLFIETEEVQEIGVAKDIGGLEAGAFAVFFEDGFFVFAEAGAFEEQAVHCPLKFADGPVVADRFGFVEEAFQWSVGFDEFGEMGEREFAQEGLDRGWGKGG